MKSMCHEVRRNSPSVADCEADVLLHRDHVADRVVLDRAQLVVVDPPRGVVVTRGEQFLRAQQTSDVIRAKRGLGTC